MALLNTPLPSPLPAEGTALRTASPAAPVGIFDSGIGGLSVLRHIQALLPHENLLYAADSAFAPYGERSEQEVVARSLAISEFLVHKGCKALVVACNTATAAAIASIRERHPGLPVVGVEPGLKPAAALTKSKVVGVLATERTISSKRFLLLCEQISAASGVRFLPQPCIGLADQIEKGELHTPATAALVRSYVLPLIAQGADTLVLGCTHYPFVQTVIVHEVKTKAVGMNPEIVDTGGAVARQLARLLTQYGLLNPQTSSPALRAYTSGSSAALREAFAKLLGQSPPVAHAAWEDASHSQTGPAA